MDEDKTEQPTEQLKDFVEHHTIEREQAKATGHRWRQRGHIVHCDSCALPHAFTVNPNELLTGIDANGYPQITKISSK